MSLLLLLLLLLTTGIHNNTNNNINNNNDDDDDDDDRCRLCNNVPESVAHVLAGCTTLAQNKYMTQHNAILKILFSEILKDQGPVDPVPPRYSPLKPKPLYEANNARAFWNVPLFAEHQEVHVEPTQWILPLSSTNQSKL